VSHSARQCGRGSSCEEPLHAEDRFVVLHWRRERLVGSALLVVSVANDGQEIVLKGIRQYSLAVHQYSSCEHAAGHSQTRRSC